MKKFWIALEGLALIALLVLVVLSVYLCGQAIGALAFMKAFLYFVLGVLASIGVYRAGDVLKRDLLSFDGKEDDE